MALYLHKQMKDFIGEHILFDPKDKVLLAVSGGIDSMAMAHLFLKAGYTFGIAHANFQLRGKDSEDDEALVKQWAEDHHIPFHTHRFDVAAEMEAKQISLQMAARELRYNWFNELTRAHSYQYIATAHHKNDSAETILLKLVKGAVLEGLHGILPKQGNIIRPLLFAEKHEIVAYASEHGIAYREDASNSSDKYQRNLVRNKVIPLLEQINPDIAETLTEAARHREQIEQSYRELCKAIWAKAVHTEGNSITLPISNIHLYKVNAAMLHVFFDAYGFQFGQMEDLMASLKETESKLYLSTTHRLIKEREEIVLIPLEAEQQPVSINQIPTEVVYDGFRFEFEIIQTSDIKDFKQANIAYLDLARIKLPLTIRPWLTGDAFIPFGMRGRKLVSDLLTDMKIPYHIKAKQPVLASGDLILWVCGIRIHDHFKVEPGTEKCLKVRLFKES